MKLLTMTLLALGAASPRLAISDVLPAPTRETYRTDQQSTSSFVACLGSCEEHRRYGRRGQQEGYEQCRDDGCRNGIRNGSLCPRSCEVTWGESQNAAALLCISGHYEVQEAGEYVVGVSSVSEQWGGKESVAVTIERPDHFGIEVHPMEIAEYPPSYWHWQLSRGDVLAVYTRDEGQGIHGAGGAAVAECEDVKLSSEAAFRDGRFRLGLRLARVPPVDPATATGSSTSRTNDSIVGREAYGNVAPESGDAMRTAAVVLGAIFLLLLFIVALVEWLLKRPIPPDSMAERIFRILIALAAGAFAAVMTGFLDIAGQIKSMHVNAGAGLAIFVIVFFFNPPRLFGGRRDTDAPASRG